jgi:hypothetical protein
MRRAVSGGMLKLRAMRLREVSPGSAGRAVTTACSAPGESAVYVSRSSCGLQNSRRRVHQKPLLRSAIDPGCAWGHGCMSVSHGWRKVWWVRFRPGAEPPKYDK